MHQGCLHSSRLQGRSSTLSLQFQHQSSVNLPSTQASELLRTPEWAAGDAGGALTAAFLQLDQSLLSEENRQELKELAGSDHEGPGHRWSAHLTTSLGTAHWTCTCSQRVTDET